MDFNPRVKYVVLSIDGNKGTAMCPAFGDGIVFQFDGNDRQLEVRDNKPIEVGDIISAIPWTKNPLILLDVFLERKNAVRGGI